VVEKWEGTPECSSYIRIYRMEELVGVMVEVSQGRQTTTLIKRELYYPPCFWEIEVVAIKVVVSKDSATESAHFWNITPAD